VFLPEFIVELPQRIGLPLGVKRDGCPIAITQDLLCESDVSAAGIKHPTGSRSSHHVSRAEREASILERLVVGELDVTVIERFSVQMENKGALLLTSKLR